MKIVCISDTHCRLDQVIIPDGDVIVHAGDALSRGTIEEFNTFIDRYSKTNISHKIYVPGNHDRMTETMEDYVEQTCKRFGIIYLRDSQVEINGIKFYGSPVTPRFHNWAWNRDSKDSGTSYSNEHPSYDPIESHWNKIPQDVDVLITHGPPKGIMDISVYSGDECGCEYLSEKVKEIKPTFHIFGHIHHWHGIERKYGTTFVNASICTESYQPNNKPIVLEIKGV